MASAAPGEPLGGAAAPGEPLGGAAAPGEPLGGAAAPGVRAWAHGVLAALGEARAEIDALNVFPVPDGDTGTNVYLTAQSACMALDEALDDGLPLPAAVHAMARGALLGARGNSGVILAEYLGGVSDAVARLPGGRMLEAGDAVSILSAAADRAYRAVSRPVEGTILTVARSAAAAARSAPPGSLVGVLGAAAGSARQALQRTPEQLEALRSAGVVDAGGRAFVVILDAILDLLQGRRRLTGSQPAGASAALRSRACPGTVALDQAGHGPAFEVMYLLDAPAADIDALRARLDGLGESVVIAGDDSLWSVHVHADDAGAAIEAGMAVGRAHDIRVSGLTATARSAAPSVRASAELRSPDRAVVAVAHGPGITALMHGLGVRVVVAAPGRRPSAAEILHAITDTGVEEVLVLPGDTDTLPVAEVAARAALEAGVRVAVIPTRAVVQSLASIAVHDVGVAFDEDAAAMTRACGATRYAAITMATRRARTTAGPCEPGDVLGIVDGDIALVGPSLVDVSLRILGGMLAVGGELVTCVFGSEADLDLRRSVTAWLAGEHPFVEVTELDGGQRLWPLIIGVE
ncbi:MAG: DAK2 domain-containing protein [Actinomycetales bacterium]|nr:DAK2 domain-containing protein [Actinomycetales bacterium]